MVDSSVPDVPLIPRTVLFGNPERLSPRLAPTGDRIAWIAPDEGVLNVWVGDLGGGGGRAVTADRDRGIRTFFWAHDGRHLLYLQDRDGDENWHVHAVDLHTGVVRDLTPFDDVQARIEGVDRLVPDRVLVGLNRDNPALHDVYRLDLASGELVKVVDNPGFVGFVADADLAVRAAVRPEPDGGLTLLVRDAEDAGWRPLLTATQEDALGTAPLSFTRDGSRLLALSSVGADTSRLVALDCATGQAEVLAGDDRYDLASVRVHPETREPQMVAYLRDRLHWEALDPAVKDDLDTLRGLHPGDLGFAGRDDTDRRWLVGFTADDGPVRYYVYDRQAGTSTFLFDHQPALAEYRLARMEPFSLTARDGLVLEGYVTFPPGVERSRLPVVMNVHGGPWARDTWGYGAEAQWLANRGYVCLQVNFRGSTGYGKAFTRAGDREWGAKMHDDLVDTVDWAVGQGWADPDRIAIYGGSYGGYAALIGATFTPDLFACAVDIVGPSNLNTLISSIPPYWTPMIAQFHTRVGDPETESDFLWGRSPLSRVGDIRIPLLIAQGANDPRVKQAEAEQIVAELVAKGIDHEYLLFGDEGHGFARPANRLRFYAAAERFLSRHLGGRSESDPESAPR